MDTDNPVEPRPLSSIGVSDDWPDTVADQIVRVVGEVRRRSYEPLRTVAVGIVLGVIIGVMAQVALVLLVIAASRLVNSYFFPGTVWAGYLIVGGIFCALGVLLWSKRRPKTAR